MTERTIVLTASPEAETRALVRLTLGEDRFHAVEAHDAEGAVLAASARTPGLLVVDLSLDDPGALEVVRRVRAQTPEVAVPALLLVPRGTPVPPDIEVVDATLALPATAFALLRKVDGLLG